MHIDISEGVRSLLIVEDEGVVAMMMEDLARELGIHRVHVCADVQSAMEIARTTQIDCAVLDLWVRDGSSVAVADLLAELEVPFFFSTGSDSSVLTDQHRYRPTISKPFTDDDFKRTILDTWSRERPSDEAGLPASAQATR